MIDDKIEPSENFSKKTQSAKRKGDMTKIPNADTVAAMEEIKAGKGKRFKSADDLFQISND